MLEIIISFVAPVTCKYTRSPYGLVPLIEATNDFGLVQNGRTSHNTLGYYDIISFI